MSVHQTPKSPFWQFDFQRGGRRFFGSFNGKDGLPRILATRPKREAEAAETRLIDASNQPAGKPQITLHAAAARYWDEKAKHFKDRSGEWGRLANLERLLGKDAYLDEITDAEVSRFVAVRRTETARNKETVVSNATVNRELECLGRLLKLARKPWRVKLPEESVEIGPHKLPEPKQRVRSLTTDEDKALFAAIDKLRPDFRDMVEFALITAKRLSEVISMEKAKVDLKAKTARVIQKGGQEIVIGLTAKSLKLVKRNWMHHPTRLWTYINQANKTYVQKGVTVAVRKRQRRPFTKDGWRKVWKAVLAEAKITNFRFHDLRHTGATRVLAQTGNLKAVQDALSHSDIASSARYAHTDIGQTRKALEAAERVRK